VLNLSESVKISAILEVLNFQTFQIWGARKWCL